ncbi:MAG: SGNH/GDSL hydrolase family protein [Planctomycetes bacterium]|nr:SGNH/GDSL hydrolase family protein [Planctomycetota bacterium]
MAPDDFPAGGYLLDYAVFWLIWAAVVVATVVFFRKRGRRTGPRLLFVGNLLVLLSLLWSVVLAAETYLRFVYDATDSYGLTLTNFSWFNRHVRVNSGKFRDVEWDQAQKPGVERVACVGDSFTFGYGVRDAADCWPQRLGTILRDRAGASAARPVEVRNYGFVGLSTGDELAMTRYALQDDKADRIVLGYCLNDIDDLAPASRQFDRQDTPRVPLIAPTFSFVADFLWFRLRLRDDPRIRGYFDWVVEEHADPRIMAAQADRCRRLRNITGEFGRRLDVVVFPMFASWGPGYAFDACHDRVAAAWKSAGVDVIDLRDAYRGIPGSELVVSRLDSHPNERAHDIAARTIAERLFPPR